MYDARIRGGGGTHKLLRPCTSTMVPNLSASLAIAVPVVGGGTSQTLLNAGKGFQCQRTAAWFGTYNQPTTKNNVG